MPAVRIAHMLTSLGGASHKAELVKHALTTKNNSARAVLAAAILSASPKGDEGTALALEVAYEAAKAGGHQPRVGALKPFRLVAAVLRARAAE